MSPQNSGAKKPGTGSSMHSRWRSEPNGSPNHSIATNPQHTMCSVIVLSAIASIPRSKISRPATGPTTSPSTWPISPTAAPFWMSRSPSVLAAAITISELASAYGTSIPLNRSNRASPRCSRPHPRASRL